MRSVRGLIVRASRDFELAKGYKQIREYVTATLLYTKSIEEALRALFISRTRRVPPKDASITYLARGAGVPEEVSVYIASMEERDATEDPSDLNGIEGKEGFGSEENAFFMDGLAQRLLDYVYAYRRI
ncbi:MAG: HEPN domain-containing protein [Candidatus Micrarchaeota archaeon]|nr:HEPN domain-containing protein [Candidatus Micrarchaeota archaeon]